VRPERACDRELTAHTRHPVNSCGTMPHSPFQVLMASEVAKSTRASNCVIIAEVAQAHDGSLGFAHAFIDSAASAGADGIKFQTHIAAAESTPAEPWRVRFSMQDGSRYDYWRRME